MNRRSFLRQSAVTGLSLYFPLRHFAQTSTSSPSQQPVPRWQSIRRQVGYFTYKGGTIGYWAGDDGLVVVDTQFADGAQIFHAGLPQHAGRNVDLLINTHHHADHTSGNTVLGPISAKIVAHRRVPILQRKAAAEADPAGQFYANVLFHDSWEASLGGETIRLHHYGPAHTSGDAVVHFVEADVIHMGDLVFHYRPPKIDRPSGASIAGWIRTLETVYQNSSEETLFLFGHAGAGHQVVGTRSDLRLFRDYLQKLLELADAARQTGRPEEDLATTTLLPGFESFGPGQGSLSVGANLRDAYQELRDGPLSPPEG